jgi:hypothetical protein
MRDLLRRWKAILCRCGTMGRAPPLQDASKVSHAVAEDKQSRDGTDELKEQNPRYDLEGRVYRDAEGETGRGAGTAGSS